MKWFPRRDTEKNWKINNPVLIEGEVAISIDKENGVKIGDGINNWDKLSYHSLRTFNVIEGENCNSSVVIRFLFLDETKKKKKGFLSKFF